MEPELREIVAEASQALIHLNAERLEEMALSCEAMNREMLADGGPARKAMSDQITEAAAGMKLLGRVLDETRSNLKVLCSLREQREGQLEYDPTGKTHGHN